MFTGTIEALGEVRSVVPIADGRELTVAAPFAADLTLGESVAINGACLTVVARDAATSRFQAGFETLERTNLGELRPGDRVNLERAVRFGDRLGGHLVTGHVDAVGRIAERTRRGEFELIWFAVPPEWPLQMVPKGSIAGDGISLTLVDLTADPFRVKPIPHTRTATPPAL